MKSAFKISFALAAAIVLLGESAATAQMGMGQGPGARIYDPATEITIHGTVVQVQKDAKPFRDDSTTSRRNRRDEHLVLTLKTGTGTYTVMVSPTWYAEEQRFDFSKGDLIEVIGSKQPSKDGDAIVAREIHAQGRTLILRDPNGIAEWSIGAGR
jgi:hypothetical protein